MKGIGFLVLLIAAIIVAVLTVTHLKKSLNAPRVDGIAPGTTLPELPSQVKKNLDAARKRVDDETKKAIDDLEKP